jgi:hypothetical protein
VVAVLLGRFMCDRFPARAFLFLLSAPLSIAVNVRRVAGTAILADYNEAFALGFYHSSPADWSSWWDFSRSPARPSWPMTC